MQQGSITNLYIARVKETPSDPVDHATAISGQGLEGDRSCSERNMRQVLFMDKETLDDLDLKPGHDCGTGRCRGHNPSLDVDRPTDQ